MIQELLGAIQASDSVRATAIINQELNAENAKKIHDALFPVVWQVLNPPFISPHLPKMYGVCRELSGYLKPKDMQGLVRLEVNEYARRHKLKSMVKRPLVEQVQFSDVEKAISQNNVEKTAQLLNSFQAANGMVEFARKLLALGGGYIQYELGHSVSCTTFVLSEMLNRPEQDLWSALSTLADFFCKGEFSQTKIKASSQVPSNSIEECLMRAVSGSGIVSLHHTITFYAIEKARNLISTEEYASMIENWLEFVGDKHPRPFSEQQTQSSTFNTYDQFFEAFSQKDPKEMTMKLAGLFNTEAERFRLGEFLIRGVCDLYDGDYDPHFITGLGSVLWLIGKYHSNRILAQTALYQYLSYFFAY